MSKLSIKCENCYGQFDVEELNETVKCPYCDTVHSVSNLLGESDEVRLERMKTKMLREEAEKRRQEELAEKERSEREKEINEFKKSKTKIVIIVCTILAGMVTLTCFRDDRILAGLVGIIDFCILVAAYMLGTQVIKEKFPGMRIIMTIGGIALLFVVFTLYSETAPDYTSEDVDWEEVTQEIQEDSEEDADAISEPSSEPEETKEPETSEVKEETKSEQPSKKKKEKVSSDFKKMLDTYEEFFDEYIKFIEKYSKSDNPVDMMADYAEYMEKYAEYIEKLDQVDEDSLSVADAAYYTKVQSRILKKLSEIE